MTTPKAAAEDILALAELAGFDLVSITPAGASTTVDRFRAWLDRGFHGEMAYLARQSAVKKRADPALILPGVRTVVTVGVNYYSTPLPPRLGGDPSRGIIARYAWGQDYHDLLSPKLQSLADSIQTASSTPVAWRSYVDAGPLLERELAAASGLGFIGKNTNLIHPRLGSWLVLGELLLSVEMGQSHERSQTKSAAPIVRHTCGKCTRCLDACPTGALVAPYLLDARRCISYLTIELKGAIPRELRRAIGNRIFGCDICQEVCPWNLRFAQPTTEPAFWPAPGRVAPALLELMALNQQEFQQRFRASPVTRAKRRGLLRNVAVALGNWGHAQAIPSMIRALQDPEPLIRGHAAWALGQVGSRDGADRETAMRALSDAQATEADNWVLSELKWAGSLT